MLRAAASVATLPFWFEGSIGTTHRLHGLTLGADRGGATAAHGAMAVFSDDDGDGRLKVKGGGLYEIKVGAGGFHMARGQKLTSLRTAVTQPDPARRSASTAEGLSIDVSGGGAFLSDINSLADLKVNASSISFVARPPSANPAV